MSRVAFFIISICLLTGCANGPIFWTRPDATARAFQVDHHECFDTAYLGYGTGNEQTYKACMRAKGWTRTQGTGSQYPDGVFFRGPEGDDEFTPKGRAGYGWIELHGSR
jgi:hypothetical protein